jgi:hypothetical protein
MLLPPSIIHVRQLFHIYFFIYGVTYVVSLLWRITPNGSKFKFQNERCDLNFWKAPNMTTMWYEEPDNSRLTKRANVCTPQCVVEKLGNADTSTDGYLEFFHGKAEAFFYAAGQTKCPKRCT